MSQPTTYLPKVPSTPGARLRALARMKPDAQLAALRRRDFSWPEWSTAWPIAGRAPHRVEVLAGLDEEEQLDALRTARFSMSEWCAFARREPFRCVRYGDEFAFIVVTTPEWCGD